MQNIAKTLGNLQLFWSLLISEYKIRLQTYTNMTCKWAPNNAKKPGMELPWIGDEVANKNKGECTLWVMEDVSALAAPAGYFRFQKIK